MSMTKLRRPALIVGSLALAAVALTACSSGGDTNPTTSPSSGSASPSDSASQVSPTATDSPSPTSQSPTPTNTESPTTVAPTTSEPTPTPTPTSTATGTASPTTAAPSPTGAIAPIVLGVTSTVAKATERIGIAVKASPSLAGKQVAILKTSNGTTRVVSTGMSLSDAGMASSYLFLQQDGDLQAVIAAKPLVAGPYDPKTQLVAESGVIHITITGGS